MIVDFHTHVFPPYVRDERDEYVRRDPTFRELYGNPKAKIATAEDVLASMERAEVDVSIVLNFAWQEQELCHSTNDYILESASRSGGRLVPFCTVQPSARDEARREMERCVRAGARGLGELRPQSQGFDLAGSDEADLLAWGARAFSLRLLFHVSEPVGHTYPGKTGLGIESLYRFLESFPALPVVAAHWGGGLPFYALMPEVREALESAYFDTAATSFLYDPQIYRRATEIVGAERILFGSDFPLLTQERCLSEVREASLEEEAQRLILGENACRLLDLCHES
jgi:predicted TIM-barrel fold metal-dependent hydrolase